MAARGHLNGAARRRRRSGLFKLAGGMGYVGSITTRGAPLGRASQFPVTGNFSVSQPRPKMGGTPAGMHYFSCAVTRRSSFRAEGGNNHRRRIPEPIHPGEGTKKLLSAVSRFDQEFRINRWLVSVSGVGLPLWPAEDDEENA
jgi:hypothetical protein